MLMTGLLISPPVKSIYPSSSVRSEEHTSELQSLMRISYAVFCLKKNTEWEIIVLGSSAGANLAASLMIRARDEGLPFHAGLVTPTPEVSKYKRQKSRH